MTTALGATKDPSGGATVLRLVGPSADRRLDAREVYLGRLSPGSVSTQAHALEVAARLVSDGRLGAAQFAWPTLRYEHVRALRAALVAEGYAPATTNRVLAAVRGVLREALRLDQMGALDYERARSVESVRAVRRLAGRQVTGHELATLFSSMGQETALDLRDRALLAVMVAAGLRRAEVVALDLGDFDRTTGEVTVRHGKGDKARATYVGLEFARCVTGWVDRRGYHPGPLFCGIRRGDHLQDTRLTASGVYRILQRRASACGLETFSPHDLRRSWISMLLDAGADLVTVQAMAGHTSPTTTARYDRRGERAARAAADLLEFPTKGK